MKASRVSISTFELATILREHLEAKLGVAVNEVHVTSYDQPKLVIEYEAHAGGKAMVEGVAFRHRSQADQT